MSSRVTPYLRPHRETRGSSPGGQPARRGPESAGASSLRGDGGVGAQHTPGGPGIWGGISQDSQGLTGHRETGADQQGRVRPRPARPHYAASLPFPLNPLLPLGSSGIAPTERRESQAWRCRRCGATRTCGARWRRTGGRRRISWST